MLLDFAPVSSIPDIVRGWPRQDFTMPTPHQSGGAGKPGFHRVRDSRSNRKTPKESSGVAVNIAANRAWKGWEWMAGFDEGVMRTGPTEAAAMKLCMLQHEKDLPLGCFWLTLLAFCVSKTQCQKINQSKWIEISVERSDSMLRTWAAVLNVRIHVCRTKSVLESLQLREDRRIGQGDRDICVLEIPTDYGRHMLPLSEPSWEALIPDPTYKAPVVRPEEIIEVKPIPLGEKPSPKVKPIHKVESVPFELDCLGLCDLVPPPCPVAVKRADVPGDMPELRELAAMMARDKAREEELYGHALVANLHVPGVTLADALMARDEAPKGPIPQNQWFGEGPMPVDLLFASDVEIQMWMLEVPFSIPEDEWELLDEAMIYSDWHVVTNADKAADPAAAARDAVTTVATSEQDLYCEGFDRISNVTTGSVAVQRWCSVQKGKYVGISRPPSGLGLIWADGWYPSQMDKTCMSGGSWVRKIGLCKEAPVLVQAVSRLAATYLDRVLYYPLRLTPGMWEVEDRYVTDNYNKDQYFVAGDVLTVGGSTFKAVAIMLKDVALIELIPVERSLIDMIVPECLKRLRPVLGRYDYDQQLILNMAVPDTTVDKARWHVTFHSLVDPVEISTYQQMRNDAAREDYGPDAPQPDQCERVVKHLVALKPSRPVIAGGSSFAWGYCYSCGATMKGTYKGRLCMECARGKNSDLGKLIAEGDHVCNASVPIVYPGVVNTKSRHPPLKEGVETWATDDVLRTSPTTLKQVLSSQPIERLGPRLGGVGVNGAIPFLSSGGARPLCEALCYRVFKLVPKLVDNTSFRMMESLYPDMLKDFLLPGMPWERIQWILSMKNTRRRKMLIRANHKLNERGEYHRDLEMFGAFVKTENLPYFTQTSIGTNARNVRYVARLIQAPHDETHLIAGRYLKPLVYRLKSQWNWDNWLFYASVKPKYLDRWLAKHKHAESWFWSDYSAFDCTWSKQAWEVIEGMYAKIYPNADADFWRVLGIWRSPKGKMNCRKDGVKVSYESDIMMASGRDDTALGNALLNGLVLAISFAAALARKKISDLTKLDMDRAAGLVSIAIVGDDSLVACSFDIDQYKQAIEENIQSFGLIAKTQSSKDVCDVTFLGMMPWPAGGELHWGPTLGRRLFKAFWQCEATGNLPAWTRGVAQQLALYRNVPILYDISKRIDDLLCGHKVTKYQSYGHQEYAAWSKIDEAMPLWSDDRTASILWLCHRYRDVGLTPIQVCIDLQTISRVNRLPAMLHLWSAEAALKADDL